MTTPLVEYKRMGIFQTHHHSPTSHLFQQIFFTLLHFLHIIFVQFRATQLSVRMPAAAGEKKDGSADSSPSPRNKKAALAKKTTTPKAADGANRAPAAKKEAASVETDSDEESKKSKQQQSAAAVKPAVKKDVEAPKKQAPTKSKVCPTFLFFL